MIRIIYICLLLMACERNEKANSVIFNEDFFSEYCKIGIHFNYGRFKADSIGYNLFLDKKGKLYLKTVVPQGCYNERREYLTYTLFLDEKQIDKISNYIDVASFRSIGKHYYQDKKYIYFISQIKVSLIKNADYQSFKVISNGRAEDENYLYWCEKYVKKDSKASIKKN